MQRIAVCLAVLLGLFAANVLAEEERLTPEVELIETTLQPMEDDDPPTIVVTPPAVEVDEQPPLYPDLSDLIIGELDSGLRGAPLSIFDSPRAIDVVTQQRITEKSAHDLGAALESTPGVLIQRTGRGQSSPFIRGLTGQQVLIMVDGVRMTNATFRTGPNQYLNTIDPNMVDRIEVIRGPGSVLYGGDAIGGVINVVTKRANLTGYDFFTGGTVQRFSSADLGYSGRVNVEGSVGSMGVFGGAGYGNFNNLDIGGTPDAPPGFNVRRQPATSWAYNSADIKINYLLDDCSELVFGLQHYRGEDVFRTDRFPANRETIFDPQRRDLYYLRYQGYSDTGFINTWQITGSFHRTKEGRRDSRPIGVADTLLEFNDEQTGVNAVFTTDASYGTFTYGADWYHDDVDSIVVADPNMDNDSAQFPDDSYYARHGFFLQWDGWLTDRLLATAGVRYEHVESGATLSAMGASTHIDPEFQDWIGQIGLTYECSPNLHLVGSISEGFRAPNLDDLAAANTAVFVGQQVPNPNLAPENSYTYEVGAKLNADRVRGQVIVWWTDLQDFIVRRVAAGNLLTRSNSRAYLNGVEYAGEYLFGCDWSLYGNFWYTYGQDTVIDEPLSKLPPMQGMVGIRRRWNAGNDWFDVYAWMADKQDRLSAADLADVNRIPVGGTPAYATVNFRYGRMITDRQRVSLNVENLFDQQYRVHGSGSDGPGINAILTYELLR